jgi:hypothetical protein
MTASRTGGVDGLGMVVGDKQEIPLSNGRPLNSDRNCDANNDFSSVNSAAMIAWYGRRGPPSAPSNHQFLSVCFVDIT